MSPVPKTSVVSARASTISMPASTARIAWSRVIAGPRAMFCVPGPSRLETILPWRTRSSRPACHAHVDDHHLGAGDAGQRVDPRQAAGKSPHHLRGHLLRILAHALLGHAVIAGHGDDRPPRDGRLQRPRDPGQIHRQVHQPPQGPMGHDQAVQPLLGLRPPTGILRGDLRKGRLQKVHGVPISINRRVGQARVSERRPTSFGGSRWAGGRQGGLVPPYDRRFPFSLIVIGIPRRIRTTSSARWATS